MPFYLTHLTWLKTLWPLLFIALAVSVLVWFGHAVATHSAPRARARPGAAEKDDQVKAIPGNSNAFFVIFGFSMLGITFGWLTGDAGHHGEPVLASVLPAVLTLIGGLAVFLIGHQLRDEATIAAGITGLTLTLLIGALVASENAGSARDADTGEALRLQSNLERGEKLDELGKKIDEQIRAKAKALNELQLTQTRRLRDAQSG